MGVDARSEFKKFDHPTINTIGSHEAEQSRSTKFVFIRRVMGWPPHLWEESAANQLVVAAERAATDGSTALAV